MIQIALDAFERSLGTRPLLIRSGGTLPIVPALVDKGIPTVVTGFALAESNVHSNERLLLEYIPLGVDAARELFVKLARAALARSHSAPNCRIAPMHGSSARPSA